MPSVTYSNRTTRKVKAKSAASLKRTALFVLLVILGHAGLYLYRLTYPQGNTKLTHFDTLLILGVPADPDGDPTESQMARVTEAVAEYKRGVADHLIFSGGAAHNRFVEANVMASIARTQGIPDSVIFRETRSTNTITNACYSNQILQAHGWHSAEIISSSGHLPRAAMIFNQLNLNWHTHAAPEINASWFWRQIGNELELMKTARYLAYARYTDHCS